MNYPFYLRDAPVDGHIYGTLSYNRKSRTWTIKAEPCVTELTKRLFPGCDGRGRGVARALLSRICADMQEKGVKTLYLTTDHTAFYEKLGWEFLCLVWEEGHARQTRMYRRKL